MVLEVLADAGEIMHDRDAEPSKIVGRTDAGQEEKLGRVDGSAADDDLGVGVGLLQLPPGQELDTPTTSTLHMNPGGVGVGQDRQVRTDARRSEESIGS